MEAAERLGRHPLALQRGDMAMRKIVRHLDVALGTVQRIAREMAV